MILNGSNIGSDHVVPLDRHYRSDILRHGNLIHPLSVKDVAKTISDLSPSILSYGLLLVSIFIHEWGITSVSNR